MRDTAALLSDPLAPLLGPCADLPRLRHRPGADRAALDLAVATASRTSGHRDHRPWRFVVLEGEARKVFGDLLAAALAARAPRTSPEQLEIERAKPLRTPFLVAAGAVMRHGPFKAPVWEQEAAAAAGIMDFLNALTTLGFRSAWLSSAPLRDVSVKMALGFARKDALLGCLQVAMPASNRSRPMWPAPDRLWHKDPSAETTA